MADEGSRIRDHRCRGLELKKQRTLESPKRRGSRSSEGRGCFRCRASRQELHPSGPRQLLSALPSLPCSQPRGLDTGRCLVIEAGHPSNKHP